MVGECMYWVLYFMYLHLWGGRAVLGCRAIGLV